MVLQVIFAGPNAPVHGDRTSTDDAVLRLYCRGDDAPQAVRGNANECALYRSNAQDVQTLHDYVCWGVWPPDSAHAKAALAVGLWDNRKASIAPTLVTIGGEPSLASNQSIGRARLFRPQTDVRVSPDKRFPSVAWDLYIAYNATHHSEVCCEINACDDSLCFIVRK